LQLLASSEWLSSGQFASHRRGELAHHAAPHVCSPGIRNGASVRAQQLRFSERVICACATSSGTIHTFSATSYNLLSASSACGQAR
jgi:hypothetical protein